MKFRRLTPEQFETLFGGTTDLARKLTQLMGERVSDGTVAAWKNRGRIPSHWVLSVERVTQIPRHRIRPDLYPAPEMQGVA